jgi:hypothetical protein
LPRKLKQKFEDTKEVTRSRKLKNRQHKGQKKKDKHWSIPHYTATYISYFNIILLK